ncbi:MAG: phosphate ABC transporter permease subunit PstC [Deltaproteobacteria bacterium]|nr:phosphate ABC transporter permease subunit PstC [Deltaproteobacteria bacterium]
MQRPNALDLRRALTPSASFWAWTGTEANLGDRLFHGAAALCAFGVVAALAGMGVEMIRASLSSIERFGLGFVTEVTWDPVRELFGAAPFIFGTIVSSLLALAIAVPVAVGVAIFLAELAPAWLRTPASFVVELLAAIPSVVYGLWGVFVLAPWLRDTVQPALAAALGFLPFFGGPARGFGMLAGGLILAIMILPTIASVSRDVMVAVPTSYREAALALGATRFETVQVAVLPHAKAGIVGAVILGLGRALGETMAVTMVIGNRAEISASLFAPAATLASVIANEYAEATSDLYLAALSELGLMLFAVTLILNIGARLLVGKVGRAAPGVRGG